MVIPQLLTHTVQKTQEWLQELSDNGELSDPQESLAVLRSGDLGAQLPTLIRGTYYGGWQPHKPTTRIRARQKFVNEVASKSFPDAVPSERAIRDVFALLAHHCDPGEISDVIGQLPNGLKELWPKTAQTFRARTS